MRYAEYAPTPYDHRGLGLDDRQDWLVAPCSVTRDSDTLDRANWEAQEQILVDVGATYETHSFGHWACGWFELILVAPEYEAVVESLRDALANYPVLDDEILSRMESEE